MKVLVTGVTGQLGYDVFCEVKRRGYTAIGTHSGDMDVTDKELVEKTIKEHRPDVVIHCAAYTAVDAAEDNEGLCRMVNAEGTENIARICKELDIKMMYISTDYVFNGQGENFWDPDDKVEPVNTYGQTKYEGELAVERYLQKFFIVRISWVFGINGKNFVKTMLKLGLKNGKVSVVNDQVGSPTYTQDLAPILVDMIETDKYGKYHATNEGVCTWYEFAKEIFERVGMDVEVVPVNSEAFPTKAKRPQNSRISKEKLEENGFQRLPKWEDALGRYLEKILEKEL